MPIDEKARGASRLSINYMMSIASEVLRRFPFDLLDILLITTIANVNAMPRPEPLRGKHGAPLPAQTGISRNAISRMLNVPLETVRRRVAGLIAQEVLLEQVDGLVFSPDNPAGLGNNVDLMAFNIAQLKLLFHGLKALGIDLG
jgi:hypothetical protein